MKIGVVYGNTRRQAWLNVELADGATVKDAIARSGILGQFPEIDLDKYKVGIFSKITALDTQLADGDRVEIYAPLVADPKEVKKKKAAKEAAKAEGSTEA